MSDVHDHSEFSGDELLAAEYALGVLAGPDRATAERRMARDRAFAALVAAWEQRLAPSGRARLPRWRRHLTCGIASPRSFPPRLRTRRILESLAFWRGFGIASTLAAACLARSSIPASSRSNRP